MASFCRDCGKQIEWVKTNRGNRPVELIEIDYENLEDGDVIITPGGNEIKKEPNKSFSNISGRIAHFSTCSMSPFRKGKR